jgi:hypothetical protein
MSGGRRLKELLVGGTMEDKNDYGVCHLRGEARSLLPRRAGWLCALGGMALVAGCVRLDSHAPCDIVVDVRPEGGEGPLARWVVVCSMTSDTGWSTENSPHAVSKEPVLVVSQNPEKNTCRVPAYADGGTILGPALGYGTVKWKTLDIYAIGYEMTRQIVKQEILQPSDPANPAVVRREEFTYIVRPWDNRREAEGVTAILKALRNPEAFRPYEALRGTPRGEGVPDLYRYYIARFDAIQRAETGSDMDPTVVRTVNWLRQRLAD